MLESIAQDTTSAKTLKYIKSALEDNLKNKYGIDNSETSENILKLHGLDKKSFDFVGNLERMINENLNDISIDDNSNKNEKTIEGLFSEVVAPIKKATGYDYLFRTMKSLYGRVEAKRLIGEMMDFSLALSDSTNILKVYSYYQHTSVLIKTNGKIEYIDFVSLFKRYEEFVVNYEDRQEIDLTNVYKNFKLNRAIIGSSVENDNRNLESQALSQEIKEFHNILVWDNLKKDWVVLKKILRHKNDQQFVIYQITNGDFAFVTANHPVILDNNKEIQAGDLKVGDKILHNYLIPKFEKYINVPDELAYFIGFLLGDGNIQCYDVDQEYKTHDYADRCVKYNRGGNLISIYQKDIDNSYILSILKKLFPKMNFWKFNESSNKQINFNSKYFSQLCSMFFNFDYKENSFSKHLPNNIIHWENHSIEALIAGLIDSDGTVFKKTGRCDIRLKSLSIINQLYDVLQTIPELKSLYKRIANVSNIQNLMFGISFVPNKHIISCSEKLQNLIKDFPNAFDNYQENMDFIKRDNSVCKIFKFYQDDVKDTSKLFESLNYVYDITTESGVFYSNGMVQHNCYALDASKLVTIGRDFGVLKSAPSKRLGSYISALCETVHQLSSHLAGAVAIGSFFLDVTHLLLIKGKNSLKQIKEDEQLRKNIENEFQKFLHSINHLSRNGSESPFTNVSIFDRAKLKTLIDEKNYAWYFPKPETVIFDGDFTWETYVIEYIMEVQNIFLDFFDKGDPLSDGAPYRFPVVTVNVSKKKWGDKWVVEDPQFLTSITKREIFRYNIFSSEGTKCASCCRLINDTEMMELASQANSFGGASISLGSHRVITINFMRIALEAKSEKDFYDIFEQRLADSAKILKAHKELIKFLKDKNLQLFISNGWVNLNRLFSTFGILGIYEAAILFKEKFNTDNRDVIKEMLIFMNSKVAELSKQYGILGNIEQIPAESMAHRLPKVDKIFFGEEKNSYVLYANQFVPLWTEATIWEKFDVDGKYNKLITGGGIVHGTIGEKITSKQAEKLIKYAIESGCEHFALNGVFSKCKNNHTNIGRFSVCPVCNEEIVEYYTRVVGFFTPISSWNKDRREWEFPLRYIHDKKEFEVKENG